MAPEHKKYGPNSEQVEAYLRRIAGLGADDWASLAQVLKDSTGLLDTTKHAIDMARAKAAEHGLLSEVDATSRKARQSIDIILDGKAGLQVIIDQALAVVGPGDPIGIEALRDVGVTALRAAATSGATLLVLRLLLDGGEFMEAWPMLIIDPRSLPDHAYRLEGPRWTLLFGL